MIEVMVRENEPIEKALKRFKRAIEQSGMRSEIRRHEYFEKPSARRRRKQQAAIRNMRRRARRSDWND